MPTPKLLPKNTPSYFKIYGINPNKFISMFQALKDRGLDNQPAFEITWQSNKEVPKGYYSFGTRKSNVNDWADNVVFHQLERNIYKNAKDSTNFQEYRKATLPYNRNAGYTDWLLKGRDHGKQFINQYIKDNNLGIPVAQLQQDNSLFAKKGVKLNGVKFINKTHNTPNINDTNQDMANYSLKLVKKKKIKQNQ